MYPFNIRIAGQKLLFIGGGRVSERKILSVIGQNPHITVIAPYVTPPLQDLADAGRISVIRRCIVLEDISPEWRIVFACTDDSEVNRMIARKADELGIWANIADSPDLSTIHMPAVAVCGGVVIAVSTEGKDPARAKKIKEKLASVLESLPGDGQEYE